MAETNAPNVDPDLLAVVDQALKELKLRKMGEFDGLLGQLPDTAALALADIIDYARNFLLDRHGEAKVRQMIAAQCSDDTEWPPVGTEADDFAVGLLRRIASALHVKQRDLLLSGTAGAWKLDQMSKARTEAEKQRTRTDIQKLILRTAKNESNQGRGLAARVHRKIANQCSYENVRKTLKKYYN